MIFCKKNFFWVIIALFAYFKCKCEKNCKFSNILQKVKSYFFANIYHSPCDSYWNSKKSIKLKPPSVHGANRYGTGTSVKIFYKYTLSYQLPRYDNFVWVSFSFLVISTSYFFWPILVPRILPYFPSKINHTYLFKIVVLTRAHMKMFQNSN